MILVFLLLFSFSGAYGQAPEKCSIEGRVLNAETGQPLNKARILLRRSTYAEAVAVALSDAQGRFSLTALAAGRYFLDAERNGYLAASYAARTPGSAGGGITLAAGQGLRDIVFRMHPYGVIAGRITDEDGELLAGVSVLLVGYRYRLGERRLDVRMNERSNDLGQYRFGNLPPGRYIVAAENRNAMSWGAVDSEGRRLGDQGYPIMYYPRSNDASGALPIELAAGTRVEGIDIGLQRTRMATVSGRVTFGDMQRPNRSVRVYLASPGNPLVSIATVARDVDGTFELRGVPPGRYVLHADCEAGEGKHLNAGQTVIVADADLEGIRLVLGPGIDLPGRVRVEGEKAIKLDGLQVWIEQVDRSSVDPAKVEADGRFLLANVQPDRYVWGVAGLPESMYLKGGRMGELDVLESGLDLLQPLPALDVSLGADAARVEGLVVDGNQKAAAGAAVLLAPDERKAFHRYATTKTDSYGRYAFKSVPPGDYKLFVFDSLEDGSYFEAGFLAGQEGAGMPLNLGSSALQSKDLTLRGTTAK